MHHIRIIQKSNNHLHPPKHIKVHVAASSNNKLSNLYFSDIAYEWLDSLKPKLKESSIATYTHKLNKHILPRFENKRFISVSSKDINSFINDQIIRGSSKQYASYMLLILKSIYRYAENTYGCNNIIHHMPTISSKRSEVTLLNESQQIKLTDYIENHLDSTSLAVAISYYTGLRIGEICALKWSDVDLNDCIIHINKTVQRISCSDGSKKTKIIITPPKSDSSIRDIPIPACLSNLLRKFSQSNDCFVLSSNCDPIEPRTLQYRFDRLLEKAGLPSIRFHTLRHMFASNALVLGFDIKALSEILGHSSASVTLKLYVHSSLNIKREYMSLLG